MPGPGLDQVGDEELAELTDVIRSGRPGWPVYPLMEHLLAGRTGTGRGCPFHCEDHEQRAHYEPGILPATCASLPRSMSFAIGVVDPGLAPFGLRMRDDADVAERRAPSFIDTYREVVS